MALGVGAGQMSRVEVVGAGRRPGGGSGRSGSVAASDAFFPVPDGLGDPGPGRVLPAVIHPGGSKNDGEVTAAADALGMAVVLAGERHFRH